MNSIRQACCNKNLPLTFTAMLFSCLLSGCGGRDYSLVNVSGDVTFDGKPLANASVTFTPIGSGVGPSSVGKTDENGHYTLQTLDLDLPGVVPGTHRVRISTKRSTGIGELATSTKEIVPPQYTDGSFHLEITEAGTDAANIEIPGRP